MLLDGRGVERNDIQGAEWLQASAAQSNSEAQYILATLFLSGRAVTRSATDASTGSKRQRNRAIYVHSSDSEISFSGGMDSVKADRGTAKDYYRLAAEQGHLDSQKFLGWLYATGTGVARDGGEAITWYRRAAEQGSIEAQMSLSSLLLRPARVTRNVGRRSSMDGKGRTSREC